jgi:hypothetical protein
MQLSPLSRAKGGNERAEAEREGPAGCSAHLGRARELAQQRLGPLQRVGAVHQVPQAALLHLEAQQDVRVERAHGRDQRVQQLRLARMHLHLWGSSSSSRSA